MKLKLLKLIKNNLIKHNLIIFLSFLLIIIIFIPLFLSLFSFSSFSSSSLSSSSSTLSKITLNSIKKSINSKLYIHSCLGALCCSFPLICNQLFDIQVIKNTSILLAQRTLILSVIFPSLVIYQSSVTGSVPTSIF